MISALKLTIVGTLLSLGWSLAANERRPWEVLRFLQQSSKFVSLPFVGRRSASREMLVAPGQVLWRAGDASNVFTMAPLGTCVRLHTANSCLICEGILPHILCPLEYPLSDDVVMGGASASTFDRNSGTWAGTVTDANNGGFIGIRNTPSVDWNLRDCKGLEWKVKLIAPSQGVQRFKFVLRDSTDFNGITWTTSVDLQPGLNTVKIDFTKQVPALYARTVSGKSFDRTSIAGVQLSYSKFEYDGVMNPTFALGDVRLQLLELRAY
jgi:hypothetical protein